MEIVDISKTNFATMTRPEFRQYILEHKEDDEAVSIYLERFTDPNPIYLEPGEDAGLNGTFVPVDSSLPAGYPHEGGIVQDIMGHTLFLLMSACKSENFTAVLDSCFSGAAET